MLYITDMLAYQNKFALVTTRALLGHEPRLNVACAHRYLFSFLSSRFAV